MNITKQNDLNKWWDRKDSPLLIAGPCSAESEEQVLSVARNISKSNQATIFRAGVWKPRTKPGNFEGIGIPALPWLQKVKKETSLLVSTEVAKTCHVEQALKHDIDVLWIGARTTVNPFLVQELAESLRGVDIPIFIKNPIHPELPLWEGAIERFSKVGLKKIGAIHRGFFNTNPSPFRNVPHWNIAIELMRRHQDIPIITDPSHIAGRRDLIHSLCQTSLDMNFDGFIIETHNKPDLAFSDAKQQITPETLHRIMSELTVKPESINDVNYLKKLKELRLGLNNIDRKLLEVLSDRVNTVKRIEEFKRDSNVSSFELKRLNEILSTRIKLGTEIGVSEDLVEDIYKSIFKNSFDLHIKLSDNKKK